MRRLAILIQLLILSAAASAFPPLIEAARIGDAARIRELVAHGADPNAVLMTNTEWTPLLHAIHKNRAVSVAALLDAGADPNRGNPEGMTPLMFAAGYGQTPIVQLLLRRGANPRLRDRSGETAFDYALIGATDVDRFTWFSCQDETAQLIANAAPRLRASSGAARWAAIKRCGVR
ncbi:MAG TPA: ankyrin repeat domain-containing protein [Thermoanaerobaculia bacterium]|nr:ankyrin repeat domain-containing protein [Thermoanaerobaculia bacterium]